MKSQAPDTNGEPDVTGRVLIVDDDSTTRTIHRTALSSQFDIETASSGEQALQICKKHLPDLVLLDVIMPDMDGYETCRQLREFTDIPIIFVTSNQSLEEHLKTFDAGGDDIIVKPVLKEILLRKVAVAIQRKNSQYQLKDERNSLQNMAMNFLSAVGEQGVLQQFMQASLACHTFDALGQRLVDAIKDFGLECSALIRDGQRSFIVTSHGEPSAIESSILEQVAGMGRMFQFKQKMVVNYDHVSVIVNNLPEGEPEKFGRLRDNIAMLAEMTDTLCDNVAMYQASHSMTEKLQVAMSTAFFETESLRTLGKRANTDTRWLLQELVDNIEKTYSWLGTSRDQEVSISKVIHASVEKILSLLESTSAKSDEKLDIIHVALRDGRDDAQKIESFEMPVQ